MLSLIHCTMCTCFQMKRREGKKKQNIWCGALEIRLRRVDDTFIMITNHPTSPDGRLLNTRAECIALQCTSIESTTNYK